MRYFTLGLGLVCLIALATACTVKDPDCADVSVEVGDIEVFDCESGESTTENEPSDTAEPDETDSGCINEDDCDGDGFTTAEDCDDTDPDTYPGAVEIPSDYLDQNCDGVDSQWEGFAVSSGDAGSRAGVYSLDASGNISNESGAATSTAVCSWVVDGQPQLTVVRGDYLVLDVLNGGTQVSLPGTAVDCVVEPSTGNIYLRDDDDMMIYVVNREEGLHESDISIEQFISVTDIFFKEGELYLVENDESSIYLYDEEDGWQLVVGPIDSEYGHLLLARSYSEGSFAVLVDTGYLFELTTDTLFRGLVGTAVGVTDPTQMVWVSPYNLLVSGSGSVSNMDLGTNSVTDALYTADEVDGETVTGVAASNYDGMLAN